MNTATPGTELPLAGVTTAMFGDNFMFGMMCQLFAASLDTMHPDKHLLCAELQIAVYPHPIYIVCDDELQAVVIERHINDNNGPYELKVRHARDGIQFMTVRIQRNQFAIRARQTT